MARHRAQFAADYLDPETAAVVAASVGREVGEIDDDRSSTSLDRQGSTVTLEVAAADLVALRAAGNTWLGLVDVAERAIDVADRGEGA